MTTSWSFAICEIFSINYLKYSKVVRQSLLPCDNTPGDQLHLSDPGWPPRASWPQYHLCQQLSPDLLILQLRLLPPCEITWIWKCGLINLINISLFSSSCNCHKVIFLQNIYTIQPEAVKDTNTCDPQLKVSNTIWQNWTSKRSSRRTSARRWLI